MEYRMSRDLNDLVPQFRNNVEQLLEQCTQQGYPMRVYFTLRDPYEQARLWRQSRSREEINKALTRLRNADAGWLADVLDSVGPQYGRQVTNALPGLSWHQWGEAIDSFWLLDGKAEWSTRKKVNGNNGYRVYADTAARLGLTAGGHWHQADWVHVQLQAEASPAKRYSLAEISREMQQRFG